MPSGGPVKALLPPARMPGDGLKQKQDGIPPVLLLSQAGP